KKKTHQEVRDLIFQMVAENSTWQLRCTAPSATKPVNCSGLAPIACLLTSSKTWLSGLSNSEGASKT
ncbi:MAG TPA: hypothetical protein VGR55_13075, partial [Candidatus Acidoferrum sp.]|nr:hypothetical protein [Candidatus Acidoferrum sp.]